MLSPRTCRLSQHSIEYPAFEFDSRLTRAVIELERARASLGGGTTPLTVYDQLKSLAQLLTSIMSARIEGNRTSILDAVSGIARDMRGDDGDADEGVAEILNIRRAVVRRRPRRDLTDHEPLRSRTPSHRRRGLSREGHRTPGAYRLGEVTIGQSSHRPPWPADVPDLMNALLEFIAEEVEPQKQLLQIAIAHHRFLWIHPFGNGNGRVARLLTYAMLVRNRFIPSSDSRAINPTAVFGANRAEYSHHLELADTLTNEGIIAWCTYLLEGLAADVRKLTRLNDADFVTDELLIPAIERMRRSGEVKAAEASALSIAAQRTIVTAADLEPALPGSPASRSQAIRRLVDRGLLEREPDSPRKYHMAFSPNDLTIHLVHRLDRVGLLPRILTEGPT
jgi:Fic family protein